MTKSTFTKITTTRVAKLEPNATLTDSELKGFGVRRRSGAPVYFLHTRIKGRLRWVTIGRHGSPWTPTTARREAGRLLGEIYSGADPVADKVAQRKAQSFREAFQHFMVEHGPKLKPSTCKEYQRIFDKSLGPEFGKRRLQDITRADVTSFHIRHAKTPQKANRCLSVLSKFMNWSELHGLRAEHTNPCRMVARFKENRRQRFLSRAEVRKLGQILDQLERDGTVSLYIVAAVRLLLLTGARLNEILTLEWRFVDLERGLIFLPDSKTGQKTIFLNKKAVGVLQGLPKLDDNPYVIVGNVPGGHLINLQKPWRRIRKLAGIEDVRLHDLRHSFASFAAQSGASLPMIGALLGHASSLTTERYAHLIKDHVQQLNEDVGARIDEMLSE